MHLPRVRAYGMLPEIKIPGTTKTLSGDSVLGLSFLMLAGFGVYRWAKTRK